MTFDQFVKSVTQDEILPEVIDTVLGGNVLSLRLMSTPKKWVGETLKVPVKYQKSSSGGSFDGYDTFSTTQASTRVSMSFNPKAEYQSVTISNLQRGVNGGKAKVVDLIGVEMESAQQDMIDNIGTRFYGDGTGNGSKDFTGLVAAVDDGTNVATYGGLSRSTYSTLQSSYTASVGALTLSQMGTTYDACVVGSDKPTLIVTDETTWGYYEQLLQPMVVANYNAEGFSQVVADGVVKGRGALKGEAGFDALWYRGTPVVKDEKCTSGYMYFLNEKYLHFYALPHPDGQMVGPSSKTIEGVYSNPENRSKLSAFHWTGWKRPVNQDAMIGQFIVYGDIINRNPNRSGVLRGITGV